MKTWFTMPAVAAFGLTMPRADAGGISGTFTATFTGCDAAGLPNVSLAIKLQCALQCAPGNSKRFGVTGLFDAYLQKSDQQSVGNIPTGMAFDLRSTGAASNEDKSFPVGVNLVARAAGGMAKAGSSRC